MLAVILIIIVVGFFAALLIACVAGAINGWRKGRAIRRERLLAAEVEANQRRVNMV